MFFLICLKIITLFAILPISDGNECFASNKKVIKSCFISFFESLEIDDGASVNDLFVKLSLSLSNVETACENFYDLEECLGRKIIEGCLYSNQKRVFNLEAYSNLFFEGDIICGRGFYAVKKAYHFVGEKCQINFSSDCKKLKEDIKKCKNDFETEDSSISGIMGILLSIRGCALNPDCGTYKEKEKLL